MKLGEWPIVAGLAASAALVFASTTVQAPVKPVSRPDQPSQEAADVLGALGGAGQRKAAETVTRKPSTETSPRKVTAVRKTKAVRKPTARAESKPRRTKAAASASPATARPAKKRETVAAAPPKKTSPARPPATIRVTGNSAQALVKGITFRMSATAHRPKVGDTWSMTATALRNGTSVAGKVRADVLHQGNPVYKIGDGRLRDGRWTNRSEWPKESAGFRITIRVRITAVGERQTFLYDVTVPALRKTTLAE